MLHAEACKDTVFADPVVLNLPHTKHEDFRKQETYRVLSNGHPEAPVCHHFNPRRAILGQSLHYQAINCPFPGALNTPYLAVQPLIATGSAQP